MKCNTLNFLVDAVSGLVVSGLIATGLLVRFVLPPGSGSRRLLWGLWRHDWGGIHFWLAFAGGVLLLVHVALHWQWVCATVLRLCRLSPATEQATQSRWRRNVAGVALVLALVGLFSAFVWAARRGVQDNDAVAGPGGGRGRALDAPSAMQAEGDDQFIRGSMTLAEAASAGAMPVEALRTKLGLPERVPAGERLGRLSREYGISMSRVREVVRDYQQSSSTQRTPHGK